VCCGAVGKMRALWAFRHIAVSNVHQVGQHGLVVARTRGMVIQVCTMGMVGLMPQVER